MNRRNKQLQKLKDREYREEFLNTTVRGGIAYQMQALRRQDASTQQQFADKVGKKQPQIVRLESTEYGGVSVQTLIDIAAALGVGLLVRFVDLAEMLERTEDMSDAALMATPIDKLPPAVPVANAALQSKRFISYEYDPKGANTWQTTNLRTTNLRLDLISLLNELTQTNYPSAERPPSGMSTQTTLPSDPISSILH